jgi:hypothetical protein
MTYPRVVVPIDRLANRQFGDDFGVVGSAGCRTDMGRTDIAGASATCGISAVALVAVHAFTDYGGVDVSGSRLERRIDIVGGEGGTGSSRRQCFLGLRGRNRSRLTEERRLAGERTCGRTSSAMRYDRFLVGHCVSARLPGGDS